MLLTALSLISVALKAQVELPDTVTPPPAPADTLLPDTLPPESPQPKKTKSFLDAPMKYNALDTIFVSPVTNKIIMYNEAVFTYQTMKMEAGLIEMDLKTGLVFATGIIDSTGEIVQKPIFTENDKIYLSDTIVYNYNTQKARIKKVITQEGEGYIHGDRVKRVGQEAFYIKGTSFTTCNLEHPHFRIRTEKAKVITGDKIVSGPAYVELLGIPTPLFLPFGYFPANETKASGFIIPTFTNNLQQGYGLLGGGYYWTINDYMDAAFTSQVYTRGGWGLATRTRYKWMYKFSGQLDLGYTNTVFGRPELAPLQPFSKSTDFAIRWSHNQDPKARPDLTFNANVDIKTPTFNRFNTLDAQNFLTNTLASSISMNKNWGPNSPFNLTVAANHNQNFNDSSINITLPQVTLNMNRIQPFERKLAVGSKKWYERIGLTYNFTARNELRSKLDGDFNLMDQLLNQSRNGAQHQMTLNTNEKVFKFVTVTPTLRYNERWYAFNTNFRPDNDTNIIIRDTIPGFTSVRDFSFSTSLTTNIYGMFNFNGWLQAVRHVMNPTVAFNYAPDFGDPFWNYYQLVQQNPQGNVRFVSRTDGFLFPTPSAGQTGSLRFSVNNTLEGKHRSTKDSTGTKKFKIIEGLTLNTAYNFAREQFKWDNMALSFRSSSLIKNLGFSYQGQFDFYGYDDEGTRINEFAFDLNNKMLNHLSSTFNVDYQIAGNVGEGGGETTPKKEASPDRLGLGQQMPDYRYQEEYLNYRLEWNLSTGYNIQFQTIPNREPTIRQALTVSGMVKPTPNWRLNFTTGYDVQVNDFTYTTITIYRDLHCWEMSITWIPFGFQQSYNLALGIKAQMFKDAKLERRRAVGDF